jgi:hypothetical protein
MPQLARPMFYERKGLRRLVMEVSICSWDALYRYLCDSMDKPHFFGYFRCTEWNAEIFDSIGNLAKLNRVEMSLLKERGMIGFQGSEMYLGIRKGVGKKAYKDPKFKVLHLVKTDD